MQSQLQITLVTEIGSFRKTEEPNTHNAIYVCIIISGDKRINYYYQCKCCKRSCGSEGVVSCKCASVKRSDVDGVANVHLYLQ